MGYHSRVVELNNAGAGTVSVPPSRYAGFRFTDGNAGSLTLANLGRNLFSGSAAADLLDRPNELITSGAIAGSGGSAGRTVQLFFSFD
jgi:hypothetical protein